MIFTILNNLLIVKISILNRFILKHISTKKGNDLMNANL